MTHVEEFMPLITVLCSVVAAIVAVIYLFKIIYVKNKAESMNYCPDYGRKEILTALEGLKNKKKSKWQTSPAPRQMNKKRRKPAPINTGSRVVHNHNHYSDDMYDHRIDNTPDLLSTALLAGALHDVICSDNSGYSSDTSGDSFGCDSSDCSGGDCGSSDCGGCDCGGD